MVSYDFTKIENKWAEKWYSDNIFEAVDFSDKPKKYILAEFPYPSGKALHAGHMMRYTVPDVYSHYLRMNGYNVLFPMGWDAFGLPAENHAIKTGVHPEITTKDAVEDYTKSMKRMGYGFDWKREINTTNPDYYKWTQWIFLKFWKEGLAQYREMPIWWCEELRTVLSDEEVLTDKNGNKISERGEFPVEKRMLKQWVLKITNYADRLIDGLQKVNFPEAIKRAQINWIGKNEGAEITFSAADESIKVFTTRPDTIFGITFMAISPEHPLIDKLLAQVTNREEVTKYVETAKTKSELERQTSREKTGVRLEGVTAKHVFDEKRQIPLYVADYVLADYGTGVVMGVPAHDERDWEFAKKHHIEIIPVILPSPSETFTEDSVYTGVGTMINSGEYNGMDSNDFAQLVIEKLEKEGKGDRKTTYKLRDWVFSRQRYWGEPIPLVHNTDGSIEAIADPDNPQEVHGNLPLKLPDVPDYSPSADGTSPLAKNEDWVNTTNSKGEPAKRETNTMPNWAGSSWYYLRFIDPGNSQAFADREKLKYWLPVDKYFGGAEHTTMHLLYSRFWHQFLYDQGLVPTPEPYMWRMNGGLLLGPDGTKMSKSKGNVIEPMDVVDNYGADALRMFICFLGPYEDTYPWNDNGVKATWRLLKNIYELQEKVMPEAENEKVEIAYHTLVKNVSGMLESIKVNTAVSEIMIFVNTIKGENGINTEVWNGFLRILAPFAPFIAEELWQKSNNFGDWDKNNSVHLQPWPEFDEKRLETSEIILPIQINGKLRSEVTVSKTEDEEAIKTKVLSDERVKTYTEGKSIANFIYVPDKIVSIVVK